MEHPEFGQLTEIPSPAVYSETPTPPVGVSPKIGEHSAEALRMVGFSDQEVEKFLAQGQVKQHSKL